MNPLSAETMQGHAIDSPEYVNAEAKRAIVRKLVTEARKDLATFRSSDIRMEILRWGIWAEKGNDYFDNNPIPWETLYGFAQDEVLHGNEKDHAKLVGICPEYKSYVDDLGIEHLSGVRTRTVQLETGNDFPEDEAVSIRRTDTLAAALDAVRVLRGSAAKAKSANASGSNTEK
jgi:hypothetical protein